MTGRRVLIVNLNPTENLDIGYINMCLSRSPFLENNPFYEMDAALHLLSGVTLEHARILLKSIFPEEAANASLEGMEEGDRREVVISGNGENCVLVKRDLAKEEMALCKLCFGRN